MIALFLLLPVLLGNAYMSVAARVFRIACLCTFSVKLFLFLGGAIHYRRGNYLRPVDAIPDEDLPIYTVLCPLYREKRETVEQLLRSMRALDYPADRLDLKLIVESDDTATNGAVRDLHAIHGGFEIVEIPSKKLKTKPNACNHGFRTARGEYLTIYDAEDRPAPDQLKKAVRAFAALPRDYVCLQAALNYYNAGENWLTRCFSVEYSMWYDFAIRSLHRLKLFFPLGGNSNHFRTEKLREYGAWDALNVTEDADIGVVIARSGGRIGYLESITYEESPITLRAWMHQRVRWMKGFMQTFCGHAAHPIRLCRDLGPGNLVIFLVFVLASFLYFLAFPFIVAMAFLGPRITAVVHSVGLGDPAHYVAPNFFGWDLLVCCFLAYGVFWIAVAKNRMKGMFSTSLIFTFYWLLHSVGSVLALVQLIRSPFVWNKTEHGLSRVEDSAGKSASGE
jgi:cellulose synthase/poly-beta-1,6-N-acetylglucosamine synthase-like glycosyltransferase